MARDGSRTLGAPPTCQVSSERLRRDPALPTINADANPGPELSVQLAVSSIGASKFHALIARWTT
jgi:hypothetical protein